MNLIERCLVSFLDGGGVCRVLGCGCVFHCECSDHYYRCLDCKHIRAFNAQERR